MLELLAQVDPLAAMMGGLWLFAAGMFPVGFMLGSPCSACCNPCELCAEGTLPETLTVTFSGLADQTPGPDLISVTFSSCYGSGATAKVTAPGGDPATDKGPISAVSLTSGGSGYAKLGRVAPTLTVSGGSGTGATFTPTLSTSQDGCKLDLWALASVAASGGTGYTDGDSLTITAATGDTQAVAAQATLYLDKSEPTITLNGTATATIDLAVTNTATWTVNEVTVTAGGTGYSEGGAVTFSAGGSDVTLTAAAGTARVVHDEPQNAALTIDTATGSGAVLTPVWTLLPSGQWPAPHTKTYKLQSVTVVNGGSGYADYELISISFPSPDDGTVNQAAWIDCDVVGTGGVIQSIFIADPGDIFTPAAAGRYVGSRTDELHSVEITNAGEYYGDDPGARYVVVDNGGSYYREDASEPPYVATVTVTVTDTPPSGGSGAVLTASVDSNTASGTFGQITGLTITNGGTNYLAWEWRNTKCCGSFYNGMSVVVKRNNHSIGILSQSEPCKYIHRMCGVGNRHAGLGYVMVEYLGASTPPVVHLVSEHNILREGTASSDANPSSICNTTFTTEHLVTDCGTWLDDEDQPIEFTAAGGVTATVTAGGEYDSAFLDPGGLSCFICCKGAGEVPAEIEAEVTGTAADGTYVLQGVVNSLFPGQGTGGYPVLTYRTTAAPATVRVSTEPCSSQLTSGHFLPDSYGCDDCHNSCRLLWEFAIGGCSYGNATFLGDVGSARPGVDGCDICEATPVCDLRGRTLTSSPGGLCGTITMTLE